jgi:hypothetical protein
MFWQPGGTERRRRNISATPCLGQETMEDFSPHFSFLPSFLHFLPTSTGNGVQRSIDGEGGSVANFKGERNEDWLYYSS